MRDRLHALRGSNMKSLQTLKTRTLRWCAPAPLTGMVALLNPGPSVHHDPPNRELCRQIAAAERRLQSGVPRAFVVDLARTLDELPRRATASDDPMLGECPAMGRIVCVSNEPPTASVVAWDNDCAGGFVAEWTRMIADGASADLAESDHILTIASAPNLKVTESLGEGLGVSRLYTLGNGTLASIFASADVTVNQRNAECMAVAHWGVGPEASSLEVVTPCDRWRPTSMQYNLDGWWVRVDLHWMPTMDYPIRWTRTSGEVGRAEQSALGFQRIDLTEAMQVAVRPDGLAHRIARANRIVDSRADVTLDYGAKVAWVLGVSGAVVNRPVDFFRIPWELPALIKTGEPLGPNQSPSAAALRRENSDEFSPPHEQPPAGDLARCDLGGRGTVHVATIAASTLPTRVPFSVAVVNGGRDTVRIEKSLATCGCVETKVSLEPIAPGAEVRLEGTVLVALPKSKRESVRLLTSDGAFTTIELVVGVELNAATLLATPVLSIGAEGSDAAVFLSRTAGATPPALPSIDAVEGITVTTATAWRLLLTSGDCGAHIWWSQIMLHRTSDREGTIVLNATAPGLAIPLRVLRSLRDKT